MGCLPLRVGTICSISDKVHWVGINDDDNLQLVAVKDPLAVARLVDLLLPRASVPALLGQAERWVAVGDQD